MYYLKWHVLRHHNQEDHDQHIYILSILLFVSIFLLFSVSSRHPISSCFFHVRVGTLQLFYKSETFYRQRWRSRCGTVPLMALRVPGWVMTSTTLWTTTSRCWSTSSRTSQIWNAASYKVDVAAGSLMRVTGPPLRQPPRLPSGVGDRSVLQRSLQLLKENGEYKPGHSFVFSFK